MNNPEHDNPFLYTPEVQLHNLLLEQGAGNALFRQLAEGDEAQDGETLVDLGLAEVAVRQEQAEIVRDELLTLLRQFPKLDPDKLPAFGKGPSYIEAGAIVDSQRTALVLFAIGEALQLWQVVTPRTIFGDAIDDNLAREMMSLGYITIERVSTEY